MFNRIDPSSANPIYAQIAERVRLAVAAGELATGDALPSVRNLAAKLLEQEGLVEMRQGAGSFIAAVSVERRSRDRASAARRLVRDMLSEASRVGLTRDDLKSAITHELDGDSRR
jgi:GntR family transcriptional regulator